MRPPKPLALLAPVVVLFALPTYSQSALVVDDDGGVGVDFSDLQAALDAAADGDVVLVKEGTYSGLSINGKSLTVVAEAGASVELVVGAVAAPLLEVRNLAALQRVVIRGIDVTYSTFPFFALGAATVLDSNGGTVWIEDGELETGTGPFGITAQHGAAVADCASVVLAGCTLRGGRSPDPDSFAGGQGLLSHDSDVHLFDSTLLAGDGDCSSVESFDGGHGARVDGGLLFASACDFVGGAGSDDCGFLTCIDGGDGGHGLFLATSQPAAWVLGGSLAGGAGGTATAPCVPGAPGLPSLVSSGSAQNLTEVPLGLAVPTPLREGEAFVISITGIAGDAAFLLVSASPDTTLLPLSNGPVLVGSPFAVGHLGTIPAGGTLAVPLSAPRVPPGQSAATIFIQCAARGSSGPVQLGPGSALVILDASH